MLDNKAIEIYSSRDQIRNQILEHTSDYLQLQDLDWAKTSYLSYLVDILSGLSANLMFYNSAIYSEFFLTKAQQKESVINLSTMLGYDIPNATPAKAQVLLKIPLTFKNNITFTLEKGLKYYADNIVFTQDNSYQLKIIVDPDTKKTISVSVFEELITGGSKKIKIKMSDDMSFLYFMVNLTQITYIYQEFSIPSLKNYEFFTKNITLDQQIASVQMITTQEDTGLSLDDYIDMIEKGEVSDESAYLKWEEYPSIYTIPSSVYGYVLKRVASGIQLIFGNGIFGKQPDSGQICRVAIGACVGAKGNVIANSITKVDRIMVQDYDSKTGKVIQKQLALEVMNTQPAQGGKNAPSTEQIRQGALASVSANQRFVTASDYQNISFIAPDLPLENSIQVLKRSDLKQNEIDIFSQLIYQNTIVPTRNSYITINTEDEIYNVRTKEIYTIDNLEFYPIFDLRINTTELSCDYIYYISESEVNQTTTKTYEENTRVLPSTAIFNIVPDADIKKEYLNVIYNFSIITQDSENFKNFRCVMITLWDGGSYPMNRIENDTGTVYFEKNIPALNIPEGEVIFKFKLYELSMLEKVEVCDSQVNVTCKQYLDEFMSSPVKKTGDNEYSIYNVPMIKKAYYDKINKSDFNLTVLDKITSFDATNYRMLTDFINFKFCDTVGEMTNLLYNSVTKDPVISTNPISIITPARDGDRYAISVVDNIWKVTPPFIATFMQDTNNWKIDIIDVNDIFYVMDIGKRMIFNGENFVQLSQQIPLVIKADVWKDTKTSISDQGLIDNIKTTLVDKLYTKFGFDKSIYQSEIISVIHNIPGVSHCKLIQPAHDIFFDYIPHKTLTKQQLLEYTPQLVCFDTTTIDITLR